ncbi:UNVERIFIED_CONTAM: hypothetical protein GTU68_062981 [Idotea baltica]|nr:hypothetical protein [Idotea baltica]
MSAFKINIRKKRVRERLLTWSAENPRNLPWTETKDPYLIWVSEIILQQTRVEQGRPYYERFIEKYPSVHDLAQTSDDELMKVWEGLGYYRRAKHMLESARKISAQGIFPKTHDEILSLKGVGPYTAAAVASFAFDLPYVVVDGNVIRLISRLEGIQEPVDNSATRKTIQQVAEELLDRQKPSEFNQAIMDFGAKQCKPGLPDCTSCPIRPDCIGYELGLQQEIPLKKTKKPKKERYFYYLVPTKGKNVYIRKRTANDIWQNLFEFYLIECDQPTSWEEILTSVDLPIKGSKDKFLNYKQTLSHQVIRASFLEIELKSNTDCLSNADYVAINKEKIRNFAFPKVIDCYLREKEVILY